jgi:hypothetical protein
MLWTCSEVSLIGILFIWRFPIKKDMLKSERYNVYMATNIYAACAGGCIDKKGEFLWEG